MRESASCVNFEVSEMFYVMFIIIKLSIIKKSRNLPHNTPKVMIADNFEIFFILKCSGLVEQLLHTRDFQN
nr:MAG TPA: hypothetical protein [Caudoviricetes sp.]